MNVYVKSLKTTLELHRTFYSCIDVAEIQSTTENINIISIILKVFWIMKKEQIDCFVNFNVLYVYFFIFESITSLSYAFVFKRSKYKKIRDVIVSLTCIVSISN